jgi:kynureninase
MKAGFSRFLSADPGRLHFAAHSHHPWPDVSYQAHVRAWEDAARLMDDKWDMVFGELIPGIQDKLASIMGLSSGDTIAFAPNTHDLLTRLFSCLRPPVRIITTDAEFHSFTRQSLRWEEEGLAAVVRVPAEPFDTFADRFTEASRSPHDMVYLSHVFFDSGFVVPGIDRIASSVSEQSSLLVVDGYHAFMALPVDLGAIQDRVFYLAGGYKYAMSGEGVCFMHCPPGYGARPVDTGWYAGFGQLASGVGGAVGYGTDGSRFSGATFDPSGLYRMDAVLRWLESEGIDPAAVHEHAGRLQRRFLGAGVLPGVLVPPEPAQRGNFLTFETPQAAALQRLLHEGGVITDHRGHRLRIGFGIYHDEDDVDRLVSSLEEVL